MSSHSHSQEVINLNSKLKFGILLNTIFTIIQFTVGIISGSLALISDAGHNLTDSLSLVISYFAQKCLAENRHQTRHTGMAERQ